MDFSFFERRDYNWNYSMKSVDLRPVQLQQTREKPKGTILSYTYYRLVQLYRWFHRRALCTAARIDRESFYKYCTVHMEDYSEYTTTMYRSSRSGNYNCNYNVP